MPEYTGTITEPGLYPGIPEDEYHADPVGGDSLSQSGAKLLLPPSCPAVYDWTRRNGGKTSREMDTGSVVHKLVLGKGAHVAVLEFDNYRTDKAKAAKKAAIAAGQIPQLPHEYEAAQEIAQAVLDDPECAGLLAGGDAEVSGFWVDPEFAIWCRMRIDKLTFFESPTIVDVKSTADASPEKFAKSVAEWRYDMQHVWYCQGLAAILGCHWTEIDFVFVAVPTTPPYLPMAYRLEGERDLANAAEDCRIAREKWRDCRESNVWPKWASDITPLQLPGYARARIEQGIKEWHD